MKPVWLIGFCLLVSTLDALAQQAGQPPAPAPADEIALSTGSLFIPPDSAPETDRIDLVFHMHGSADAVADLFLEADVPGVLITVHLGMFSSPYQRYFSDERRFAALLDEALGRLRVRWQKPRLQWGHICVVAFSGGYGGARELMRQPAAFEQIDSMILLDCPHTGYTEAGEVVPAQMEGFLRFARAAVQGQKQLIVTHSEIVPGSYASTTECADYLIAGVDGKRQPWTGSNALGMQRDSTYEAGGLRIYGYQGDTAEAHMQHFYGMPLFLNQIHFSPLQSHETER